MGDAVALLVLRKLGGGGGGEWSKSMMALTQTGGCLEVDNVATNQAA